MQLSITVKKKRDLKSVFFPFDPAHPLYVRDIGTHKTPPDHIFGPAVRPYFLLHLIESGKGEVERSGNITKLSAGEAFLIRPGEVVTYRSDKAEPWEYYWISFYGSFAETVLKNATDRLFMKYRQSGIVKLKSAVDAEIKDSTAFLNVLFEVLNSIKTVPSDEKTDVMESVLYYLENNYFHSVDVSAIAAEYGYSRAHFSVKFSKKTGKTPYRYLTDVRIAKAKELLKQTELSVQEIAYSVGFSSSVRFCELFKKYTGKTPSEFRIS